MRLTIHLSMKSAALSCFVCVFLFAPTFGMIWFVTNNPARTQEYEDSDLRTMFTLISIDLAAGQPVMAVTMPMIFSPPNDRMMNVRAWARDPNNNWIDEETGLPYDYRISGHFWNMDFDVGLIQVVALEQVEEMYEAGSSLTLNLTVSIDNFAMYSFLNCIGNWRLQNLEIQEGFFGGTFSNAEIRYRTTIQLIRNNNYQILGPRIGQSNITVNRVTTVSIGITDGNDENLFSWERAEQPDGEYVDEFVQYIMSAALPYTAEIIDEMLRRAIGNRLYSVSRISPGIAAANVSGYSCRRPEPRRRRETTLYN